MRVSILALLVLAAPAAAQEDVDCDNAMSQVEMTYCASLDFEAADAALNEAYAAAMEVAQGFDGDQEALLRDAQRAWIAFRDAACSAEGSLYEGGTMQPMAGTQCLARLSAARADDLWIYAETGAR